MDKYFTSGLTSQARAILQRSAVNPVTVPLPQQDEHFLLTYNHTIQTDTLFNNLAQGMPGHWRTCKLSRTLETGGKLEIIYAASAEDLFTSLNRLKELLVISIPLSLLVSLFLGYLLSGVLLSPVKRIINKANNIDLRKDIELLSLPGIKDELFLLTEALNRMLSRINRQSREQNAFFAAASHELRTPLSNMLTQLQVYEAGGEASNFKEIIPGQVAEIRRLCRIVDDFLLMGQLKAGKVQPHQQPLDLVDACLSVIEREGLSEAIQFNALPEDISFIVTTDKNHLQVILGNIFSNAAKYHQPHSAIQVSATVTPEGSILRVSNQTDVVIDNMAVLGQEFNRPENRTSGFGLGLWIAKQLSMLNQIDFTWHLHKNVFTITMVFNRCI